jgi:hypothetical protein
MTLRVFSYGGGVQSTAALVLAAQGEIDFKTFLFANVGDDSEHPATLRYVREVAMPYAEAQGIELGEVRYWDHGTGRKTLYGRLTTLGPKGGQFIGIPLRLSRTGRPGRRSCTNDYKVLTIERRLREMGATTEGRAVVGLGISLDELQRARSDGGTEFQETVYPLIDLRLTRQDCIRIIERAGLEVPPKSSCWFCPYHSKRKWQEMRNEEPDLFWKSVELERGINERLAAQGFDPVWLTDWESPLDQATSPHRQLPMFTDEAEDACESGYCMV